MSPEADQKRDDPWWPRLVIVFGIAMAMYSQLMGDTRVLVFGGLVALGGFGLWVAVLKSQGN